MANPAWIRALKRRAEGGKVTVMCRHPDIDSQTPRDPMHADRICVLDANAPENCDQSKLERWNLDPITDKAKCPYWRPLQRTDPAGATPAEVLRLIEEVERLRALQPSEAQRG